MTTPFRVLVLLTATAALAPAQTPEEIYQQVLEAGNRITRPAMPGAKPEQIEQAYQQQRREAVLSAARIALREHRYRLRKDAGVFFRGRLLAEIGSHEEALSTFNTYIAANQDGRYYHHSLLFAAELSELFGRGPDHALFLLSNCKPEVMEEDAMTQRYLALSKRLEGYRLRAQLHGLPCPDLKPYWSLNAAKNYQAELAQGFSLKPYTGKAVVIFYLTPWNVLCQHQLRDLVGLQRKFGDKVQFLAVVGLTGQGWEFPEGRVRPGHGRLIKAKEGRLSTEVEVGLLQKYLGRCQLENFPVLIETPNHARTNLHVDAQPTTFILGKDGRVVGHLQGYVLNHRDNPSTRRIETLIEQALDG